MNDIVREFLVETNENLAQLDLDLVTLEKEPGERETLARVFRTLHTVKGTAGFLGLGKLQAVAHAGENLLSRLRAGELSFTPEIATALLAVVDAIREVLAALEATGDAEGDADYSGLIATLERLTRTSGSVPASRIATPTAPPVPPPAPPAPEPPPVVLGPSRVSIVPPPTPTPTPTLPPTLLPTPTLLPPPAAAVSIIASEPAEARASAVADSNIRVEVELLDKLMTLVGELVLARNQLVQFGSTQEDAGFLGTLQRLNLLTTELQAGVMKTRMQPVGSAWGKFPRVVRDLAVACGKQVRIDLDGQDTELDKTIIEAIRDPLTHVVRNAVDHGIEPPAERVARGKPAEGRLHLDAFHEGGKVVIEITDDGGGIDPIRVRDKALRTNLLTPDQAARLSDRELVNLVFFPGFSTTDRVTHFSGRGVGMDVVRTNVEKIGGTVDLDSRVGHGTTVRMKLPLTLAIIPALTVACAGDRFCIPQVSLLELVRLEGEQIRRGIEFIHGVPVYRLRGSLLPLVYLNRELQVGSDRERGEVNIVVLQTDVCPFGLVVDQIHDTEEIVVKPLRKQLKGIAAFSGATILGDGRVALILDVLGLAQRAGVMAGVRERAITDRPPTSAEVQNRQTVLLFAVPGGSRMAIPLSEVARLEEFPRSAVERAGAREVVQYRGEILPLIRVARILRDQLNSDNNKRRHRRADPVPHEGGEPIQVVVCAREGRRVGIVVSRIIDIVEESITVRSRASRPEVLFTAVVQERVTEFLDVDAIIRLAEAVPIGVVATRIGGGT